MISGNIRNFEPFRDLTSVYYLVWVVKYLCVTVWSQEKLKTSQSVRNVTVVTVKQYTIFGVGLVSYQ